MSRDNAVRIAETIAFIRTATVPPAHHAYCKVVADMLRDREAAGLLPTTASSAMSRGSNFVIVGRDAVTGARHHRGAIIPIRMALANGDRSVAAAQTTASRTLACPPRWASTSAP